MRTSLLAWCLALAGVTSGCTAYHESAAMQEHQVARDVCYEAVDRLLTQHEDRADIGRTMVATLVDINEVKRTSMLGRQLSDYIASRLTQRDIDVIHTTLRQDHMIIREEGQFLLSREVRNLARDHNARTVLVGTYGMVAERVLLSIKLVSTVDDSILAAVDFSLKREGDVEDMLKTSARSW
ncbi:MAG: hypothetical protein RL398_2485 [Planctomycetota bacterium]|jgi:TolB-like protein